jgi:hypothetical protein
MNTPTSKKTPICPKTSILQKYARLSGFRRVFAGYITGLLCVIVVLSSNSAVLADPDASIVDLINPDTTATITEAASNDTQATAQDLDPYFDGSGITAVLVNGSLTNGSDIDYYKLSVPQNGQFDLKFNLLDVNYQTITAMASRGDKLFFITDTNTLWLRESGQTTLLATAAELAEPIAGLGQDDIVISDIAVNSDGKALLSLTGRGDILEVDSSGGVTWVLTNAQVLALTGESWADLISVVSDDSGTSYVADQVSGSVIQADSSFSSLQFYSSSTHLSEALQSDVVADLAAGTSFIPTTILAQTQADTFNTTGMVIISGSSLYTNGIYITNFSAQADRGIEGDGSITHIATNETTPADAVFTRLFDPNIAGAETATLAFHPTALAVASASNTGFGNKLYMANFGADMGDAFDGHLFVVEPDGSISDFVTAYVDPNNNTVLKNSEEVTGFFDVIDIAFSGGGFSGFGNYIYLLSENIKNPTGVFSSDLWRVDNSGVAHLFVEGFADGAGSLAFGTTGAYNGYLYVATWQSGSEVFRIDTGGNVTSIYQFGSSEMVLDMAFSPVDSIFGGALLFMVSSGSTSSLVSLDAGGTTKTVWTAALQAGDVPGGDIAFDAAGNLIGAFNGNKSITRIDHQNLFDYTLGDLQLRSSGDETVPYLLISVVDQPRILSLGQGGSASEIATEVSPRILDLGTVPDNGSKNVCYTFDDNGDIYFYVENYEALGHIARNDTTGIFDVNDAVTLVSGDTLDSSLGLTDTALSHLAWMTDGSLFGIAGNGITPAVEGGDAPSQVRDDIITLLVNTKSESYVPSATITINQLNSVSINVEGPDGFSQTFTPDISEIMEKALDDLSIPPGALTAGTYYVAVGSVNGVAGDYEVLAAMEGILETITITGDDLPMILTTSDDERLEFSYTGSGQAALWVERSLATDKIVNVTSLTVTGSTSQSEVSLRNIDNDGNLELQTITLTRSMYSLACGGKVDTLAGIGNRSAAVRNVILHDLRTVDAPRFSFQTFTTANLGDPNATEQVGFDARSVSELNVNGDIDNIYFFISDGNNRYDDISVSGVINNATFYGDYIGTMTVFNVNHEETAMADSGVYMSNYLTEFMVSYGDVDNSTFLIDKKIDHFELSNGNLRGTSIATNSTADHITELLVYGDSGDTETPVRGNITNCQISSDKMIKKIYAEGQIDEDTLISVGASFSSTLKEFGTGGNCAAVINASKIDKLLIGFDRDGNRKVENEVFTGADFTGSITALMGLKTLIATGSIQDATIQCSYGKITSIFAEDGFDAAVTTNKDVTRIMVGFINGQRRRIANPDANVDGSISAAKLGRLYYTGTRNPKMTLPARLGPIVNVETK